MSVLATGQELLLNPNNMSVLDSVTKQVTLGTLVFNWIFDQLCWVCLR